MPMRWVTAHAKGFLIREKNDEMILRRPAGFNESITRRAVHELLIRPAAGNMLPLFPALVAARAVLAMGEAPSSRRLAWVDSAGTFYPPAAIGGGISLDRICVLRPRPAEVVWATIELLRCKSIGAVVTPMMQALTRVEVRRLQLAAETGGGIAVLIRPDLPSAASHIYAAATRWLVTPAPGERAIQRWHLQFVHGQGRQIDQSFILEKHRASGQTHFVHLPAPLAHHPKISAAS
jgi:hypothetical protein